MRKRLISQTESRQTDDYATYVRAWGASKSCDTKFQFRLIEACVEGECKKPPTSGKTRVELLHYYRHREQRGPFELLIKQEIGGTKLAHTYSSN